MLTHCLHGVSVQNICEKCSPGQLRALSEPAAMEGETPRTDAFLKTKPGRWRDWSDRDHHEFENLTVSLERELAQMAAQRDLYKDDYFRRHKEAGDNFEKFVAERLRAESAERRVSELEAKLAEAQRDAERLRERGEIHYMEFQRKSAVVDALIQHLCSIHNLMHPKPVESGGKVFSFTPPDALVREAWEGLSKAIREIPAAIDAALAAERKEGKKDA